jgi:hypothetical protein
LTTEKENDFFITTISIPQSAGKDVAAL